MARPSHSVTVRHIRADLPVWIVAHYIPILLCLALWGNWYVGRVISKDGVFVASIAEVFALAWLISFRIVITPSELIFRSLFRGGNKISHNEIRKVRLAWKFWRTAGGPLLLIVEPKESGKKRELIINAKVFSKEAIDAVLNLGERFGESDDGGLRDGIVWKTLRDRNKFKGR